MLYLKSDELKLGMRLAKPLYNSAGVLLYNRNTTINERVYEQIQSLNLYGLYVLEPAEPLPPINDEEVEFERFQTVSCNMLQEIFDTALHNHQSKQAETLCMEIMKRYGGLGRKIVFMQNIRGPHDFVYKHCLNVAILCTLISNNLGIDRKEIYYLINASFYHDIGKILAPPELINKTGKLSREELNIIRNAELNGFEAIRNNYDLPAGIRRYITQLKVELCNKMPEMESKEQSLLLGTDILRVADMYDTLTAMRVYKKPTSEYSAIKFLLEHEDEYNEKVVEALIEAIHILPPGACVELTNGEKGIVLKENEFYHLRPTVLGFESQQTYDLGNRKVYSEIQIKDIMKTMDNRFVMSSIDTQ